MPQKTRAQKDLAIQRRFINLATIAYPENFTSQTTPETKSDEKESPQSKGQSVPVEENFVFKDLVKIAIFSAMILVGQIALHLTL